MMAPAFLLLYYLIRRDDFVKVYFNFRSKFWNSMTHNYMMCVYIKGGTILKFEQKGKII